MTTIKDKYFSQFCDCIPINSIVKESYDYLIKETEVIEFNQNKNIFSIGDNDPYSLFLMDGEIEFFSKDGKKSNLSNKQQQSDFALSALKPRLFNARALSKVIIARINTQFLNKLIVWKQSASSINVGNVEVNDFSLFFENMDMDDSEWKMAMLKTPIFLSLPTANIMALFDNMEVLEVTTGQQIIKQDEPGDYYYIIKIGYCSVSRCFKGSKEENIINELGPNDCFGEEALVSGKPRNANVTMKTNGTLLRLSKKHFNSLLKEPILHWVNKQQAKDLIDNGAIPIDVRMEDEYNHSGIKNMLNIPLYLLRLQIKPLGKNQHYVLFCDNGARSSAAAFIMTELGFKNVSILKGGLSS